MHRIRIACFLKEEVKLRVLRHRGEVREVVHEEDEEDQLDFDVEQFAERNFVLELLVRRYYGQELKQLCR